MSIECLVGIDVGTTSTRIAIYGVDGTLFAAADSPHKIEHPRVGWAEQNAEVWWEGVCVATNKAFDRFNLPKETIKGIAITSMRQTFVCLGGDLQPLRPAIVWYDTRHTAQVDWVRDNIGTYKVYEQTGSPPGRRAIYKVKWLKDNEPEIYNLTYKIAFIPDYILLKLTGELITTPGVSFASGCLDVSNPTQWAEDFITQCGLDPSKWIGKIDLPGKIAGRVTEIAASITGFPKGTPVVLAAGDQACGNLGVGVCRPGILGINGGTSCALQTPSIHIPIDEAMGFFVDYSPAGYYVAENGVTSGTAALSEWFRDNFGQPEAATATDDAQVWEKTFQLAAEAPPGNDGLMLVPFLRGANGPRWNSRARGLLVGLKTDHGREHLMRAIFEGLAYESRWILEGMESSTGVSVESVRTYGGASKSDIWNQTFANILDKPITVTKESAPVSLGAVIAAGYGVGLYNDPVDAAEKMTHIRKLYEPDSCFTRLYQDLYQEVYLNLYSPLQEQIDTLSRITNNA